MRGRPAGNHGPVAGGFDRRHVPRLRGQRGAAHAIDPSKDEQQGAAGPAFASDSSALPPAGSPPEELRGGRPRSSTPPCPGRAPPEELGAGRPRSPSPQPHSSEGMGFRMLNADEAFWRPSNAPAALGTAGRAREPPSGLQRHRCRRPVAGGRLTARARQHPGDDSRGAGRDVSRRSQGAAPGARGPRADVVASRPRLAAPQPGATVTLERGRPPRESRRPRGRSRR